MKHRAQGFEHYTLKNSYNHEDESFWKSVKNVAVSDLPTDANVIDSNVLFKVKQNDDGSLKMTARIARHCNEDNLTKTANS